MTGIYFSGTGNTRYCIETFIKAYGGEKAVSIEAADAVKYLDADEEIVFGYPVQFSALPKIVKDFIDGNAVVWRGKKVFVLATMGLFSGDGAGVAGRLLKKYAAEVTGGLHVKMPDSIGDEKALKRPLEKNRALVRQAREKVKKAAALLKAGNPPQEGLRAYHRLAGLFGQRLYFGFQTRRYSERLKINAEKCIGCGTCIRQCPMKNIGFINGKALPGKMCAMCYRCVNICPEKAVTLLGTKVVEQCRIEKYL